MVESVSAALHNIWLYGILFYLVMMFVVVLHESGHYFAARMLRIPVEGFSFGFGKEILGHTGKSGTRWSLRRYPLGGYVSFAVGAAYDAIPVWRRAAVAAAGPAANLAFGILLLALVYMTLGKPSPEPYVAGVIVGSPAEKAGIKIGDVIESVDGRAVHGIDDMKASVANKIGQTVSVTLKRDGETMRFEAIPALLKEKNDYGFETRRGYLGSVWPSYGLSIPEIHEIDGVATKGNPDFARQLLLKKLGTDAIVVFGKEKDHMLVHVDPERNKALSDPASVDYSVLTIGKRPTENMKRLTSGDAIHNAVRLTGRGINATLGQLFQVISGRQSTKELGGVVRISTMTGKSARKGAYSFLNFIAVLSVNLGFFNLLPLPMLDGGHLLFLGIEAARGRPVGLSTRALAYGIALVGLIALSIFINSHDLLSIISGED